MLFTILFSSMVIPIFVLGGTILFLTYRDYRKQKKLELAAGKGSPSAK